MEEVILVNEHDEPIGLMEKIQAHREGRLHRAFSVLIFNDDNEILIHRRADDKYHCGGLWTNACCSHPREHESTLDAALRRLQEEMGFYCPLFHVDEFIYKAHFDNGLIEYEYDHIFIGAFNENPYPNPWEVADWKYVDLSWLKQNISEYPDSYTAWFKDIIINRLENILKIKKTHESLQKNNI